jgi:hypothetical protein
MKNDMITLELQIAPDNNGSHSVIIKLHGWPTAKIAQQAAWKGAGLIVDDINETCGTSVVMPTTNH